MTAILYIFFTLCLRHQILEIAGCTVQVKGITSNIPEYQVSDDENGWKITITEERENLWFKTAIIGPTEEIQEIEGEICMEDDETAESVIAQILRTAMNYDDCPLPVSEYEVVNEFEIEISPLEEYLPSGFTQAYAAIGLYGPDNDGSADADAIWFVAINE